MPPKKAQKRPATPRTNKLHTISLHPQTRKLWEWYRDTLPPSQRTLSGALESLLFAEVGRRHREGLPTPEWFEVDLAKLS